MRCDFCHQPVPADARADARFCRATHRTAWHNARRALAFDLVMRQTRAAIDGAPPDVLDAILAEAVAAFGDDRTISAPETSI